MSESESAEKYRQKRMLRRLKKGDKVVGTIRSRHHGSVGMVVDPEPFQADGVRRVKVLFDDMPNVVINVLPSSIEEMS